MKKEKCIEIINKLLRLSNSSNEHEAKLALEKAYTLMLKYDISKDDVGEPMDEVIEYKTSIYYTAYKNNYICNLAHNIAEFYRCVSYSTYINKSKKRTVTLMGNEDDCKITESVILFIKSHVDKWFTEYRRKNSWKYTLEYLQATKNNYGEGFTKAIIELLEDKRKFAQQEWGLVVTVPQEAIDYQNTLEHHSFKATSFDTNGILEGYMDGKNTKLEKHITYSRNI